MVVRLGQDILDALHESFETPLVVPLVLPALAPLAAAAIALVAIARRSYERVTLSLHVIPLLLT